MDKKSVENDVIVDEINVASLLQAESTLSVNVGQPGVEISPTLYGTFFEDINSAADGGIYAELIKNRSFEFGDGMEGWLPVKLGAANGRAVIDSSSSINEHNLHYLRMNVEIPDEGFGIANSGYGGIAVEQGQSYEFSIYARSESRDVGSLNIAIQILW